MKFKEITLCLDMAGCPNRCRHCWLGAAPNGHMATAELESMAKAFRPYADCLQVYDWYREPDYRPDYRDLFTLCNQLSDRPIEHFELASFWRLARDRSYAPWLKELGVKTVQLTLFGTEETTDCYVGRKGAYREILTAMDVLLANGIAPRIQVFINQENIGELGHIESLIDRHDLESRCLAIGGAFSFFLHQGSCDGENEKLYDAWVTPEDLEKIPERLASYTLRHFGKQRHSDVFGQTEQALYQTMIGDPSTAGFVSETPVFYIDKDFGVYPNITTPSPASYLGNLKKDGAEAVLRSYLESRSPFQHARLTVPLRDLAMAQGDPASRRLFDRDDYTELLLNRYCRSLKK